MTAAVTNWPSNFSDFTKQPAYWRIQLTRQHQSPTESVQGSKVRAPCWSLLALCYGHSPYMVPAAIAVTLLCAHCLFWGRRWWSLANVLWPRCFVDLAVQCLFCWGSMWDSELSRILTSLTVHHQSSPLVISWSPIHTLIFNKGTDYCNVVVSETECFYLKVILKYHLIFWGFINHWIFQTERLLSLYFLYSLSFLTVNWLFLS